MFSFYLYVFQGTKQAEQSSQQSPTRTGGTGSQKSNFSMNAERKVQAYEHGGVADKFQCSSPPVVHLLLCGGPTFLTSTGTWFQPGI